MNKQRWIVSSHPNILYANISKNNYEYYYIKDYIKEYLENESNYSEFVQHREEEYTLYK